MIKIFRYCSSQKCQFINFVHKNLVSLKKKKTQNANVNFQCDFFHFMRHVVTGISNEAA